MGELTTNTVEKLVNTFLESVAKLDTGNGEEFTISLNGGGILQYRENSGWWYTHDGQENRLSESEAARMWSSHNS